MRALKERLKQEKLKELIDYEQDTGVFRWKAAREGLKVGSIAGCVNNHGYVTIRVLRNLYQAHRLAFLFMEGYFPENGIDHIDRNKKNNKWSNLREVSAQCNKRNCGNSEANTSGIRGVSRFKDKWQVRITINYVRKSLGYYKDFDEAVCMRLAAEQCFDWPDCNNNDSPAYSFVKEMVKSAK